MNIQQRNNIIFCKSVVTELRHTIYYVLKKEENLFIEKCYTIRSNVLKRDFGGEAYMLKYQLCTYIELHTKIYKKSFVSYKELFRSLNDKKLKSEKRKLKKRIRIYKRS